MPSYRVYFIEQSAHIGRPPKIIECADDVAAAEEARQFINGNDIEVWREGYLVIKYARKT